MKLPFTNQKRIFAEIEEEEQEPVPVEEIEELIKLITVASEVKCEFELHLGLEIGGFSVKSDNFKGIKMLKATKTQPDRLVISYSEALLLTDTMIELPHIVSVVFKLNFSNKSDVNV